MVTAAWDTSNLVALYRDGVQCTSCCTEFVPGSPPTDCCCFLDPDTNVWNAGITYGLGDLAEGAGGGTYESLQDNNLNHAVGDGDWWDLVSSATSCGNVNWDSNPPYGGPGKTPAIFSLTFKVTWLTSGLTTTYHSDNLTWGSQSPPQPVASCPYYDGATTESGGKTVIAWLYLRGTTSIPTTNTVFAVRNSNYECNPFDLALTGDTIINVAAVMGACDIRNTYECTSSSPPGNCCLIRSTNKTLEEWEWGSIEISWHPGAIPEWDECTDYDVGDIVAWEGVFYECKVAHNAGTPPTCEGKKEPPNEDYWEVL